MGKISRSSKLLKEINRLEGNCSDTEYDESDLVENENEYLPSNNESASESSDTDSIDEILRRLRRKSKRVQVFSNSESESDQDVEMSVIDQDTEISVDGTMTARGLNTRKIISTQHFQRNVYPNGILETTYYER